MPVFVRVSGAWKKQNYTYVKVSGAWKTALNTWARVSGAWKRAYTYGYSYSGWSACSKNCGGGTQTRTATCKRSDGLTVTDAFCTAYGVSKGALSQSCNTHSCYAGGDYTSNSTFTAPHNGTYRFTVYGGGGGGAGGAGGRRIQKKNQTDIILCYTSGAGGGGGGGGYFTVKDQYLSAGQAVYFSIGGGGGGGVRGYGTVPYMGHNLQSPTAGGRGGSTVISGAASASADGGYGGGVGTLPEDKATSTADIATPQGGAGGAGSVNGGQGENGALYGTHTTGVYGGAGGGGGQGGRWGGAGGRGNGWALPGGTWNASDNLAYASTDGSAGSSGMVRVAYIG